MHTIPLFVRIIYIGLILFGCVANTQAEPLRVGQASPNFTLKAQDGKTFELASRKGQGWTVLYFFPKAGTPGCTTQACAFRDAIDIIRKQNAEVYGISTDDVADLAGFHSEHKLRFDLLSDAEGTVTNAYGVKMPLLNLSKRWTFIIDPNLIIRGIDDDVDPALDAHRVANQLEVLKIQIPER